MEEDRRIREKLVARGAGELTGRELVSIVLGEGCNGLSAASLADRLMAGAGESLWRLSTMELSHLRTSEGIGMRRAAVLAAAFELGRRAAVEGAAAPAVMRNDEDVAAYFRPRLAPLPHEEFWVVCLSSGNTVRKIIKLSHGGVSATTVDHRIIVKQAVELLATSLILVHNHPSGVAEPSAEDIELTRKIAAAAALFDIAVLDHIVITPGECCSFRNRGLI